MAGTADGLVLRLESAASVVLRLRPVPPPSWSEEPPRALVFLGEPEGDPVAELDTVLDPEGRLSLGGLPPGTCTLWIDVEGFAPVVLRDVKLGPARTDLGEVVLEGLGPGRFHVRAGARMSGGTYPIDETIEVDGHSDVSRTLDLR